MPLQIICTSCLKSIPIDLKAKNRRVLSDQMGASFTKTCEKCGHQRQYHVNDVKAVSSFGGTQLLGTLLGLAVIIVVSILFWNRGFITNVGLIIGGGILAASNLSAITSNEKAFNDYRLPIEP